ncbi:hypothetical protein ASPACDRAFT_118645 [Aspergillus aculeatus ATCC 16872]|uniref:Uncharacterized protein n=1 Tax=Aspergillus aculeatus (strain ATCC 16872 / CBS 172.66 / WB 5094) TaxID=690307 RepID=A0A1L9WW88_ASPA1|nr:uncharacterized protein ASPACDRAFT_118645 [Aspergillus aculeatus ATCC 16872]OJK00404.1 hypothetical protein ASPACDRAFT_118645 [Aspergillus aculeatus ATCC 16872]
MSLPAHEGGGSNSQPQNHHQPNQNQLSSSHSVISSTSTSTSTSSSSSHHHQHHAPQSEPQYHDINNADPDPNALEKQSTVASGFSAALETRTHSIVSRIRSREPGQTARFTHPLSHTKTTEDVIVDFDGPDDPYRPMNWSFRKKAITTVLYGLTTMGMFPGLSYLRGGIRVGVAHACGCIAEGFCSMRMICVC